MQNLSYQVFSIAGAQSISILCNTVKSRVKVLSFETILKHIYLGGKGVIFGDHIVHIKMIRSVSRPLNCNVRVLGTHFLPGTSKHSRPPAETL